MVHTQTHDTSLAKDILITILITLAVIIFSAVFEKTLMYNNELGGDGAVYYKMAQQMADGKKVIDESPYVYRVGIPFLVARLFPDNLLLGFRTVNFIGSILSIFFLLILLRNYISKLAIRMFLIGVFVTHWIGPLRTALTYPTQIEPSFIAINLLAFVLISSLDKSPSSWKVIALGGISLLGTLIRKSYILIPLIYTFAKTTDLLLLTTGIHPRALRSLLPYTIPLLLGAFGIVVSHLVSIPSNSYSLLLWMLFWIYQKPLPAYVLGYFITFGPLLAILYPARTTIKDYLTNHHFHLYYLITVSALAWAIGSDTDRFFFWAMPIWLILFGLGLEYLRPILEKSAGLCMIILLAQCISQRTFLPSPSYAPELIQYRIPVLTVICNEGCSLDIPSYHGLTRPGFGAAYCSITPCYVNGIPFPIKIYQLLEYIIVIALILIIIARKQRAQSSQSNNGPIST